MELSPQKELLGHSKGISTALLVFKAYKTLFLNKCFGTVHTFVTGIA